MFNPKIRITLLIATTVLLGITAIAWSGSGTANRNNFFNKQDTVPFPKHPSPDKEIKWHDEEVEMQVNDADFDNEFECDFDGENFDIESINDRIENALREVEDQIQELHSEMDPESIRQQVEESLQDIDIENINEDIEQAVQQAVENIDFKQIESEIRRSVNETVKEIKQQRFS
ncbi:MAG: hypothetical protein JST75_22365 [Bacteroidetes bacterium]|nr:hypothetical protein [Bacteroidota bacterium]